MSHRYRADDEAPPVQALRAAAEANEAAERDRSTRTMFSEPGRGREAGRGGDPSAARVIGGLQADAGNGAVAWLLHGSVGTSHVRG